MFKTENFQNGQKLSVRLICDNCNYCKEGMKSFRPERLAEILRGAKCPNCGKVSLMQNRTARLSG